MTQLALLQLYLVWVLLQVHMPPRPTFGCLGCLACLACLACLGLCAFLVKRGEVW